VSITTPGSAERIQLDTPWVKRAVAWRAIARGWRLGELRCGDPLPKSLALTAAGLDERSPGTVVGIAARRESGGMIETEGLTKQLGGRTVVSDVRSAVTGDLGQTQLSPRPSISTRRHLVKHSRTEELHDVKLDVKVVLCGLWISMLFVFAYVDILGFWRADVIKGALAGRVPGPGFEINQAFLVLATVYILIPSLMVLVSLLAPASINRTTNIVVSLIYLASVLVSIIGETWIYFILGSVIEALLLLAVARAAWTWPPAKCKTRQVITPAPVPLD